ncbi:MarR family transcriptional regulator [Cystobacter fuscus]|uniref:MarR family transcriptional regulator n=1 Tax=Cystobacter fuscus TaxID=43 RepID=A0A250J6W3_9BACT|nr:MarR family winged helix-turn-helix transcriptional regulator [Cystobacter fuscus]ATB39353.1 MarR family transcriptional regulator [Cystobacter fuscus]
MKELDERERRAWSGLLRMQDDLRRHISRQLMEDSGLSWADFAVLFGLFQQPDGRLRVFELRDLLRWEKTRLIHQVSRMATRGLIERQACQDDSRGSVVALTEAGREIIQAAAPRHLQDIREVFFDVLTPRQLDVLADVAEAVLDNIDEKDGRESDLEQ